MSVSLGSSGSAALDATTGFAHVGDRRRWRSPRWREQRALAREGQVFERNGPEWVAAGLPRRTSRSRLDAKAWINPDRHRSAA